MVELFNAFGKLLPRRILVAGDLLLDKYTKGEAKRISPEAPVAVVRVTAEEERAGGAGNVILNLISIGASVTALGRVGVDSAGASLLTALQDEGVSVEGVVSQKNFATPVKQRIVAGGQQVVRVDYEEVTPLDEQHEELLIRQLPQLLSGVEAIALSDYGKGTLTLPLLQALIEEGRRRHIPIIADPKGTDFSRYHGATLLKPNLGEAYAAAAFSRDTPLELVAGRLLRDIAVDVLMVTRSEEGISLFYPSGSSDHYPVKVLEVRDVTGAGDTVLALLTFALANGLGYGEASQLANVAAGIAIEHFGCARVTMAELGERLLSHDTAYKIFFDEHLYPLQQILKSRPYVVLVASLADGLTPLLFETIQTLATTGQSDLLLYLRDEEPLWPLIRTLAFLHSVSYIVVSGSHISQLCTTTPPKQLYLLENGGYRELPSLESVFYYY